MVVAARGLVGEHSTALEEWHSGAVLFLAVAVGALSRAAAQQLSLRRATARVLGPAVRACLD